MNNKHNVKRYQDAEPSPRIAAHRERIATEGLVSKNKIIQRMSNEIDLYREAESKFIKEAKQLRGAINELRGKVLAYQSTAWKTRAWLLIKELFGQRTEILQG